MKYPVVIVLMVILFLLVMPLNFSFSEIPVESSTLQSEIESIFKTRADIWNDFILGGYETFELLEKDLRCNTVEPLITSDLSIFNEINNNPTSYELIQGVSVKSFEVKHINKQHAIGNVEIAWTMQDLQSTYVENIEYVVNLTKMNDRWMLSDYTSINN